MTDCVPTTELPGLVSGRLYAETTIYIDRGFGADFTLDYEAFRDIPGRRGCVRGRLPGSDSLGVKVEACPRLSASTSGSTCLQLSQPPKFRRTYDV